MNTFTKIIARKLNLSENSVENTLQLLNDGCSIPFISRYRKERTGTLDEVQISNISDYFDKLSDISKRKETIIKTITDLGKMNSDLNKRIENCWDATELEDIYIPYKPKRRTKAQIARERGLEPLSVIIKMQREHNIEAVAKRFIKGDITDINMALKGAQDIIAEDISENEQTRQQIRNSFNREAIITSKAIKNKIDSSEAIKYSDYFDFSESLKHCSSHRLLAMRRGEHEGFLRVNISIDDEKCIDKIKKQFIHGYEKCSTLIGEAIEDSYKRLLQPSIENEFANTSKEKADDDAISIFAENLRQLLLAAPLGPKRVMGIDPGFRTGCKIVCLDEQGSLLHHEAIFSNPPKNDREKAGKQIMDMTDKYKIEAMAIGNGTASRETSDFIKSLNFHKKIDVFIVSEDGASIYSASKTARDEFPDEDVTVRGAVSIGRRLIDPLAELVKIDPKNIGVGQYQHDVDQSKLKKTLDNTVESCVNTVGVNLNTASLHILMYISGLGATLAKNIIEYRKDNGAFSNRNQLKNVPRLGPSAFQQCAGFLRIPTATNPLDNSAVHPESYNIVENMAKDCHCSVSELIKDKIKRAQIDINKYITKDIGLPTLNDIMKELEKPGRDPREQIEVFEFDKKIKDIGDLVSGMILPGIVTNITKFGAFVDIGIHQDGLVHISQMADKFILDPTKIVKLHQHVKVKVLDIDNKRNRISLSMKDLK